MKITKIFAAAFGIGLGVGAGFLAAPVISGDNVYEQVKNSMMYLIEQHAIMLKMLIQRN